VSQDKVSQEELEALIALAKQKPAAGEAPSNLGPIQQWIIECDIKPGKHVITPTQFWFAYRKWAKEPISFNAFNRQIKNFFPRQKGRGASANLHYYLVDPAGFDLSLEFEWEMKAWVREERRKRNSKSNAKKNGKPEGYYDKKATGPSSSSES
jgi:hypothetical protein